MFSWSQFSIKDKLVLALTLGLVVCGWGIHSFSEELLALYTIAERKSFYQVTHIRGGVFYKPQSEVFWLRLPEQNLLASGDSIFCEQNSVVELEFEDGSILEIKGLAFVQILDLGLKTSVDVLAGEVKVKRIGQRELEIRNGGGGRVESLSEVSEESREIEEADASGPPIAKETSSAVVSGFPKHNSLLLYQSLPKRLSLVPGYQCESACEMTLKQGEIIISRWSGEGQLKGEMKGAAGLFHLEIRERGRTEIITFELAPYSIDRLEKGLVQEKDVSILD